MASKKQKQKGAGGHSECATSMCDIAANQAQLQVKIAEIRHHQQIQTTLIDNILQIVGIQNTTMMHLYEAEMRKCH